MSNIDAILAGLGGRKEPGVTLWLGTVTQKIPSVLVLIDGADTAATVINGPAPVNVDDRVIVTRIGRNLYVLRNLTT